MNLCIRDNEEDNRIEHIVSNDNVDEGLKGTIVNLTCHSWINYVYSPFNAFCQQLKNNYIVANRLSSTIGGNREMDQLYTSAQVSNITRKHNFLTLVDMTWQDVIKKCKNRK